MAMHEINIPPMKVWVRKEYLYDDQKGHGEYVLGVTMTARAMTGQAMLFQVLLEDGSLRDKLPINAITHKLNVQKREFDELQLWNCFSANFSLIQINYLAGMRVDVFNKRKQWESGHYLYTFQWGADRTLGIDMTLAEDPSEHKSGHFIKLDTGEYAIQPNNRLRFHEPSFVTKPFPDKPDYKVNTQFFNCESKNKWVTEDSDAWFYKINETNTKKD